MYDCKKLVINKKNHFQVLHKLFFILQTYSIASNWRTLHKQLFLYVFSFSYRKHIATSWRTVNKHWYLSGFRKLQALLSFNLYKWTSSFLIIWTCIFLYFFTFYVFSLYSYMKVFILMHVHVYCLPPLTLSRTRLPIVKSNLLILQCTYFSLVHALS